MGKIKLSREALAYKEIGFTLISRRLSQVLSLFFILTIFLVPIVQYGVGEHEGKALQFLLENTESQRNSSLFAQIKGKNTQFLQMLDTFETEVEEESFLRSFFLPPLQSFFLKVLGQGNEKVVAGKEGWLFYRPGIDSLTGPAFLDKTQLQMRYEGHELWEKPVQPDPVKAIVDFSRQLSARGVQLIMVPVPVKPSIHPEKISAYNFTRPPANPDWETFLQKLQESDIKVFDSRPLLYDYARKNDAAFLTKDTHWLPAAMDMVAEALAAKIQKEFPDIESSGEYSLQQQSVAAEGDVAQMLTLPDDYSKMEQTVDIAQVVNGENELWQPQTDAEILLLGDSFTNIYSTIGLGWGRSAGFAEHLSYHLQLPLDLLSRNDSGAYVTREMLGAELARGRDRLADKKLVIWEFAERELSLGDWKIIDLTLGTPVDNGFYTAEAGEKVHTTGVVAAVSRSPRPGSVPYRDNIVTLHLVDLSGDNDGLEGAQALVYAFGMRDNNLTEVANIRPGDRISITLSSWDEVENEYGSYRRSPLDDEMMELELPNWGTIKND
jgi:alginate O-acetyltransferase complex protein AlgJ